MKTFEARIAKIVIDHENHLQEYLKQGFYDQDDEKWSFWNAMFFCGTVYTTIGNVREI